LDSFSQVHLLAVLTVFLSAPLAPNIVLCSGAGLHENFIDRFPAGIVYWTRVPQLLGRSMKGER
jgi:hypothetical protein